MPRSRMAEEQGLDLVEVAATARPPVVRIMDYGKYKFEMAKQARLAKKKQHVIELKEVKYRPGIDDHDFDTKTRHARRFLEEKNKVKVTMMFRGRQVAHPELGQVVLDRVAQELADVGKIESDREVGREVHDDDPRAEVASAILRRISNAEDEDPQGRQEALQGDRNGQGEAATRRTRATS